MHDIVPCPPGIRSCPLTRNKRTLLVTKGIATRSKDATRGAPGLTRNKDASSFEAIPISNSKKDCLVWRPLLLKVHEGGAAKAVTQWHLGRGHQLELEEQGRAIPEKITELLDWPFCFRCCPLGI